MGSFRSKGRNHGLNRRRSKASSERQGFPRIESLEDRRLLTGGGTTALQPIWHPTSTNIFDAQNGPMANLGLGLVSIYKAYIDANGNSSQLAAQFPLDQFQNGMVGVQLKSLGGDFNQYVTQLTDVGMHVNASSAYYGVVMGYAPINALPTIAQLNQTQSGSATQKPIVHAQYQGEAYNEAETSMFADIARSQFNLDGTGVTVGVLSDSVSQFAGGLADSYKTLDLDPNAPVNVVQDGVSGSTDEGRAMLENVHDVAPGAGLAFATAFDGTAAAELNFANNIKALANTAKANIIVDDISYLDEPYFQDGWISQAINTVTAQGVTYFSSAGNQANDGYLSTFRPVHVSNDPNFGSGTFMNFNPNGGTSTQLKIVTDGANAAVTFEFDQPYQFQEPAGSPGQVTSQVEIYLLDSSGNVVISPTNNQNNVAMQQPVQQFVIPDAGTYFVMIKVVSGANPGHVEFINNNEQVNLSVDQQYGSAGGTYYPTSVGHETTANTIGVGATPWWAPAPYLGQTPLASEPFSSFGPGLYVFDVNGKPLASPTTTQSPVVTAPDGGNTSFFSPGQTIDTTNPPFPGEPASSTNLVPPNQQSLPTFFGTSSAAPNAAAVGALMKQKAPSATPAQIRAGLIASTTPMNGAAAGAWNVQAGFGEINAIKAISAVDQLRVSTTTPANGATLTNAPSVIQVVFNKPVDFSSLSAADLTFTSAPANVTVKVGAPIIDPSDPNPAKPTIIDYPISFTKPAGILANGAYTFTVQSPAGGKTVVSQDGKTLVGSSPISFTLNDVTAPVINNVAVSGRTVTITFSKALDPNTVTLGNIFVLRQNGASVWPPPAGSYGSPYFNLNSDPRAAIGYNPLTNTVTLDYSGLPQSEMPSDNYAIVVLSKSATTIGVTDLVGNALFGAFNGSFPTGQGETQPKDFIDNLGFQALQAPIITTFTMSPTSDTGIAGDQNTNNTQPQFIGQVFVPFPGSISGDQVYIQFSGTSPDGTTTLKADPSGRGFTVQGTNYLQTVTDSSGAFRVTAPALPEGFQSAVAVVVGQPDSPPLPGFSSQLSDAFRIDKTAPQITAASFTQGGTPLPLPNGGTPNTTNIASLSTLSLMVIDPSNPQAAPFGTPTAIQLQAIDPATASNVSNYSLINTSIIDPNTGKPTDESQFIASAAFVPADPTISNGFITAYNGFINLTFSPGLPAGNYQFIAHTQELKYPGLADAAGNFLDDRPVDGENTQNFILNLSLQNTPVYVTSMAMENVASGSTDFSKAIGGPQSYYELPPASGQNTRDNVLAPPNTVVIDLSNPIPFADYTPDVLLVRSADSATSASDGDFGTLGQGGLGAFLGTAPSGAVGKGFTIVGNTAVTLYNTDPNNGPLGPVQSGGSGNRLVLQIAAGTNLPADDYRVYLPNQVDASGNDTRIYDIYGNQLDGEFLGNPTSQLSPDFSPATANITLTQYQDELSDGTFRQNDTSGDGVAGGAFMTGFEVVPYGNVVYSRPDFVENPLLPNSAGLSDGSMAKPYPVLAPEGDPNSTKVDVSNPTHNPNLGLNDPAFFQPGIFSSTFDFSGDGKFEQSAFYAASQLAYRGPVVVVALPGLPSRSPITGAVTQASYSLVAPAGNTTGAGGSASVPYNTLLVFQPGSALKLQSSSLFVQNQGSALQAQGTAADPVVFTSYNDASVGGATNNNPNTTPHAGDWGGVVFRNYDEAVAGKKQSFPVDGNLVTPNGAAVSGSQDAMSIFNFADVSYAGGAVPLGSSNFYSGITLYNSRPMITNSTIAKSGGTGGTEGAIGADMDSLREDDTARGPLVRNVTVTGNSINGFYLMAGPNGLIEPTDAIPYPDNPTSLGGSRNFTLAIPLPVVLTAELVIGQRLLQNTGGQVDWVTNRLYIQPGSMIKFNKGAGIQLLNPGASLNVGSRSYINGYDANNSYGPGSSNFVEESANDPTVLFTSIFDDTASTPFVPAINVTGETTTPTLGPSMWGSVGIITGGIVVVNDATFQYGGGAVNAPGFTIDSQSVLAFITFETVFTVGPTFDSTTGTHAYITNNNFYSNFDAAMQIEPNGLLAGDPLRPLLSGHPFFRGNVMQRNGIDGMAVVTLRNYLTNFSGNGTYIGPIEAIPAGGGFDNQTVDAVWDATDLTYVVRGSLVLGGAYSFDFTKDEAVPLPDPTGFAAEPSPTVTLTIQSALPGTELANGENIPSPGQSVIVKMLNDYTPFGAGSLATPSSNYLQSENAGAGFIVGVDDGVDPPANSPLVDPGAYAELRILGIPANQSTGQERVPVIITSLRDGSVGTTVRGVPMFNILNSDPANPIVNAQGASKTAPAKGDGGTIYIGGNSMHAYSATDPFDGSIISNADISYMTRIEVQGGGIIDAVIPGETTKPTAPTTSNTDWWDMLSGYLLPTTQQLNTPMSLTILGSNLADFSDAAVFVHPNSAASLYRDWTGVTSTTNAPFPARGSASGGEPVFLYMYNDTVSNSGEGVHINSQTGADQDGDAVYQAVIMNVTFNNNTIAVHTVAPAHNNNPDNSFASVETLLMNDIIANSSNNGVEFDGQNAFSQLQYCVFFGNANNNVVTTTNDGDYGGNEGAIFGDPKFVGPVGGTLSATAQNFELQPDSIAIDGGRSEIGPIAGGNALYPGINYPTSGSDLTGTRTDPSTLPATQVPGRSDLFGDFGFGFGFGLGLGFADSRQIVTLPGSSGTFTFPDQWQPALPGTANAFTGPSSAPGTYLYQPETGIRDILGLIRSPDPNVHGLGFGSNPFVDVGAYEYVNLHPPEVTAVTATVSAGTAPVPFYTVGGKAGSNTTPLTINVTFNEPINPSTLTGQSVQLEELGLAPGTTHKFINLSGKLEPFDNATNTLVIDLAKAGLSLPTDAYRLILFGSGSPVIQNTQGIALDGENLSNGNDANSGVTLPLPSGNGFPGGNFYDPFIINTTPPSILKGSIQMSPSSDTNIVGDDITASAQPTFTGTISEPNPNLVPLNGQTAVLDVGVALLVNGQLQTFFDPSQLPAGFSTDAQYIRPNAGTGVTDNNGNFTVTVGTDAASSGLVTVTTPLPDLSPILNVGADGVLSPLPGDDSGYYVARIRAVDQSGNQSDPNDPNSRLPFVVDTTGPTAQFVAPATGQVFTSLTNGAIQFTITTSENIDMTHFTASSIQLINGGPDGTLGTADDVTIPIDPNSIQVTFLDKGTGGAGREQISFASSGALTNNVYQVTVLNTGTDAVRDIAGNSLASPVSRTFAVAIPSLAVSLYVGGPSDVLDPTAAQGTRENPYPTIGQAMTAATAGDTVAVLPGVYTENVTLKQFVRLLSADPSSTDSTIFTTSTGDPLSTIIRAPFGGSNNVTITADNIQSFPGLASEIAGFTIASPLLGDPAIGIMDSSSIGLEMTNSNLLIDKDYFADSGNGIFVTTSGAGAATPTIENNVIVGNINGVTIFDAGSTAATTGPVQLINNDFAFNTIGLNLINTSATPTQAYVASNIFWQNHDQTNARNGFAIFSATPNLVNLRNNLFQGNGSSDSQTSNVTATNNLGNGFSAANLSNTPDSQGNFVGSPQFAFPIDPRPGSDGPANLFVSSNFDLTARSAAIDNAWESTAIPTDILGRSQVKISGGGFGLAGYGPRDIGAYEFDGTGGIAAGGAFRVVTSSLVPVGGAPLAGGGTYIASTAPNSITLTFSQNVDPKSIAASDLVLSGSAANPSSPVHATSLTWIDSKTVRFNLSGPLTLPGTLSVAINANLIHSVKGQGNLAYSDKVVLQIGTPPSYQNPIVLPPVSPSPTPTPTPHPTPTPTSTGTPTTPIVIPIPVTPAPAPAPVRVHPKKPAKHVAHKPAHHVVAKHAKHAKHVKHVAPKHAAPKHLIKKTTVHPKATTSLKLSLAGHHKHKAK